MTTLNDAKIRIALRQTLNARVARARSAVLLDEFSLSAGRTRADLAVVNGHLCGYEIKSDRDTLERLPDQMRAFNSVFDRMTLVVGWRHAAGAMRLIPAWWGVQLVDTGSRGAVRFSTLRVSARNPSQHARAVAALLWRDEAVAAARQLNSSLPTRALSRRELTDYLAEQMSPSELRLTVCSSIKSRQSWRAAAR